MDGATRALTHYRPGFYDGTITLIRADVGDCDPVLNWTGRSRQLKVQRVPGDHLGMVLPPVVNLVAHELSMGLAAATFRTSEVIPRGQS
jgi:thioesterase domain-containing protein